MEYILIAVASFFISAITFFSGFGLGTLLLPVFALFLPVEVAVAATAVVHAANNLMKVIVVGRRADYGVVLKFGIPAIVAACAGAALLGSVSKSNPLAAYTIGGNQAEITPIKLLIGLLMLIFALFEFLPALRDFRFKRKYIFIGGFLSGFFGGLSGHQGALRSAFLVKTDISTEAFVGTNAVIAVLVDIARLIVYGFLAAGGGFGAFEGRRDWVLVLTGISSAFFGVLAGRKFVTRISMPHVQFLTGFMLLGIAIALGAGII